MAVWIPRCLSVPAAQKLSSNVTAFTIKRLETPKTQMTSMRSGDVTSLATHPANRRSQGGLVFHIGPRCWAILRSGVSTSDSVGRVRGRSGELGQSGGISGVLRKAGGIAVWMPPAAMNTLDLDMALEDAARNYPGRPRCRRAARARYGKRTRALCGLPGCWGLVARVLLPLREWPRPEGLFIAEQRTVASVRSNDSARQWTMAAASRCSRPRAPPAE